MDRAGGRRGTPLYRANLAVRAVALTKGRHEVRFDYGAPEFFRGLTISLAAIAALLLWVGAALYAERRARHRTMPS